MEKDTIIEFGNSKYLLLDGVKYNGYEYFTAESLKFDGSSKGIYGILKFQTVGDNISIDTIRDPQEMVEVVELIVNNTIRDCKKLFFETGSIVEIKDKKFVVLDYIPYHSNVYVVLITHSSPAELMIAKVIKEKQNNEMSIIDVSGTAEALAILQIHASIYGQEDK